MHGVARRTGHEGSCKAKGGHFPDYNDCRRLQAGFLHRIRQSGQGGTDTALPVGRAIHDNRSGRIPVFPGIYQSASKVPEMMHAHQHYQRTLKRRQRLIIHRGE